MHGFRAVGLGKDIGADCMAGLLLSKLTEYDNLELKAVLDAAACFLMESDSGLLCDAYHSTELGETDCTRMFIMDSRCYPQWYAERQGRFHAAKK